MIDNPFDILLLTVSVAYFLTAFLTYHLMSNIGFPGIFIGIAANLLIHLNLVYNGERIFSGGIPDPVLVLKGTAYMTALNILFAIGTYFILRSKSRSYEIPTVLALLLSSVFFWNLYIPVVFALVILAYPAKSSIDIESS